MMTKLSNEHAVAAFAHLQSLRNAQTRPPLPPYTRTTFGPKFFSDVGRDPDKWVAGLRVRLGTDIPDDGVLRDFFEAALSLPTETAQSEAVAQRLATGIRKIMRACVDGRVCDDVAWFDDIETLFDKCASILGDLLPEPEYEALRDAHPAPPLAVTDEMVERALAVWFHPMRTPTGDGYSEGMRAALTAALEAKQ